MSHRGGSHSSNQPSQRPGSYRYVGGTIDERGVISSPSEGEGSSEKIAAGESSERAARAVPDLEIDPSDFADQAKDKEFAGTSRIHPSRGGEKKPGGEQNYTKPKDADSTPASESSGIPRWLIPVLVAAEERGAEKARLARAMSPQKSRIAIGAELIEAASLRAGIFGAAAGSGTIFSLPIGFPAGIAAGLFAEAELIFSMLALYDFDVEGESGRARLAALWAGGGSTSGAQNAAVQLGSELLGKALAAAIPARLLIRFEPLLVRAILKRIGLGFLPRMFRMWPLLGAPIAFAFDRAALRALGNATLVTLASREPAMASV